jgi:hypothetical protein
VRPGAKVDPERQTIPGDHALPAPEATVARP